MLKIHVSTVKMDKLTIIMKIAPQPVNFLNYDYSIIVGLFIDRLSRKSRTIHRILTGPT